MGVRGLTSFIARHAEQYLTPYELHDCNLVIDGDNLACNLYKDVCGSYSAFGGDYDDFYRAVLEFFHVLAECNVRAYVLMDGGYEWRKLRTVGQRLRGKISVIKRINPCGSVPVFPLMMREVFVDAVRECGVPVMRCVFEADDELATLSRKLNCPVLSYDSDFYIHNVQYIPLVTVTVKAHTKLLKENPQKEQTNRRLRKTEAKHLEKLTKSQRILSEITTDNVDKKAPKKGETYKYLDCCMYRIKNLVKRKSISKEKLPLFAALLGNDYIARSAFRNFFVSGMGKGGRSRKLKQQQRRIRLILQWLKNETAESALNKIMTRLKKAQRDSLQAQVNAAISGYSNEKCHSYDYFVSHYENAFNEFPNEGNESSDEEAGEEETVSDEDESDELKYAEEGEENKENVSGSESDSEAVVDDELVEGEVDDASDDVEDKTKQFPKWFIQKLYPAHLPRFFVDLIHLKKYINSPQIEHFPFNECHEIAIPILIYIFTLVNSAHSEEENEKLQPRLKEDGTPLPVEFTYLTRATNVTDIRYLRHSMAEPPRKPFRPEQPDAHLMREVFERNVKTLDVDRLFDAVEQLPKDLQLYFIGIIFWLHKSQHCDLFHLHALIVCLVTLRTIDTKVPPERELRDFQKCYGKIIKKERSVRDKEVLAGIKRSVKVELQSMSVPDRMPFIPKSDCYLVMDNLLKHFHMQDIFKKKYDLYSSTVLHSFAQFQSVLFQLHSLNALLDFPYESPHLGQLYCGTLLYNIYDLVKCRADVSFYVQNFVFQDSLMMFEFYEFLWNWCEEFIPEWKRQKLQVVAKSVNKKALKKQRQAARKKAAMEEEQVKQDPNIDMVEQTSDADEFHDLNNKFCNLLKIA